MIHREQFKTWLPDNDVSAVANYLVYTKTAEEALKVDLDTYFDKIIREAIDRDINEESLSKESKDVSNSKSAVRKYWDFLKDKAINK
jgi:hypothetical protein